MKILLNRWILPIGGGQSGKGLRAACKAGFLLLITFEIGIYIRISIWTGIRIEIYSELYD